MKLSSKIFASILLMTIVGAGIAGAQDINLSGKAAMRSPVAMEKMQELKSKIGSLPADVKAQLKAARQAGDLEKVKSILTGNGIQLPAMDKLMMHKRHHGKGKGLNKRWNFKNLPDSVRAELKAAFQAHDMAKVKSILQANGIGRQNTANTNANPTANQ